MLSEPDGALTVFFDGNLLARGTLRRPDLEGASVALGAEGSVRGVTGWFDELGVAAVRDARRTFCATDYSSTLALGRGLLPDGAIARRDAILLGAKGRDRSARARRGPTRKTIRFVRPATRSRPPTPRARSR
ncbi:MAG: hypothetical protein AB7S26_33250 [Sandaracinaceae bacterium]